MDIRVKTGWLSHPKTLILIDEAGPEAALCLVRLWCFAAENRPTDGDLTGYTDRVLEMAAGWTGEKGALVEAMTRPEAAWLDGEPNRRTVHDWAEHQAYLVKSEERSQQARDAAAVRYAKRRGLPTNGPGDAPSSAASSADSIAPSSAPVPAPAPAPAPALQQGLNPPKPPLSGKPEKPPDKGGLKPVDEKTEKTKREMRAEARVELGGVVKAISSNGRDKPPTWPPRTAGVIRQLGGFNRFCDATARQLDAIKKQFVTIYVEHDGQGDPSR